MSRSYRKPWIIDGMYGSNRKRFFKNYSNRKLRRLPIDYIINNGSSYKQHTYLSYDICDYRFFYNPNPRISYNWKTGEFEWREPDPEWRYNRK